MSDAYACSLPNWVISPLSLRIVSSKSSSAESPDCQSGKKVSNFSMIRFLSRITCSIASAYASRSMPVNGSRDPKWLVDAAAPCKTRPSSRLKAVRKAPLKRMLTSWRTRRSNQARLQAMRASTQLSRLSNACANFSSQSCSFSSQSMQGVYAARGANRGDFRLKLAAPDELEAGKEGGANG